MSTSRRGSLRLLYGSAAALLLLAGCGSSSKAKSTQTSSAAASQQTTASVSTSPRPSSQPSIPGTPTVAGLVTASSDGVTATLHAGTHHPKVNQAWPIRFTVSRAGRPTRASVSYEYLFGGQVVAHRSHYTFTGHFSDVFRWPSSAVGYPLTFRAVIVSEGATIDLDYPVQVIA
jgi:hypothetical protein